MTVERIHPTATRILLAVVDQRRPTVQSVADAVGRSKAKTHFWLVRLRDLGLVEWEDYLSGTLRATVRPVAFGVGSGP